MGDANARGLREPPTALQFAAGNPYYAAKKPRYYIGGDGGVWGGKGGDRGSPKTSLLSFWGFTGGEPQKRRQAHRTSALPIPIFILYYLFFLLYYFKRTSNARPYSGSSRRRSLRPPRAAPSISFRDCGRGRGVPRCEHREQWGFRRGWRVWGVLGKAELEGWPGVPRKRACRVFGGSRVGTHHNLSAQPTP